MSLLFRLDKPNLPHRPAPHDIAAVEKKHAVDTWSIVPATGLSLSVGVAARHLHRILDLHLFSH
jgi:hypothetical protein